MTNDERKAQNEAIIQRVLDDARNGGYVFPQDLPDPSFPNGLRREGGLTLRDYFAAQALPMCIGAVDAAIKAGFTSKGSLEGLAAIGSYVYADAMLAERAKCAK